MLTRRSLIVALLAPLLGLCGAPTARGQNPKGLAEGYLQEIGPTGYTIAPLTDDDVGRALGLVEGYLQEIGAAGYTVAPVTDDYVARTFPGTTFFAVWFRQYPVVVDPMGGLAAANVFYVQGEDVNYLTGPDQLEEFFFEELGPVANPDETADAGRTWLRLSEEFSQDGFYAFGAPKVEVTPTRSGGYVAGQVTVTEGGKGSLRMRMVFDPLGQLLHTEESRQIRPGVRPICQATKLLDADPLVRRMAEQDLLVMGKAAKHYLDFQRTRARPELRQAIDRVWKRIVDEGW